MRQTALSYVQRGWPVLPLHGIRNGGCTCRGECTSPGKHPLVRRGLHEATLDLPLVDNWWTRWPAANVGIATGAVSGLAVIDLDGTEAAAALARLEDMGLQLPPTLTAMTGNGRHLYFTCDRRLPNTTRSLPGLEEDLPGIDLRADGGYVVAPPSVHANGASYGWLDPGADIAPLPRWIKAPVRRDVAPPRGTPILTGDGTPYGLAALQDEIDVLASTPEGSRNDQLNRAAFALGQLIAGGELAESPTRAALETTAVLLRRKAPQLRAIARRSGCEEEHVAQLRERVRVRTARPGIDVRD